MIAQFCEEYRPLPLYAVVDVRLEATGEAASVCQVSDKNAIFENVRARPRVQGAARRRRLSRRA
jgi:hypothetical protein